MGFFEKLLKGLKKTREGTLSQIKVLLGTYLEINDELYEELEELLVAADVGIETAGKICEEVQSEVKRLGVTDPMDIVNILECVCEIILSGNNEMVINTKPSIILIIGVNGVGKTTSIGKLASYYSSQGRKVMVAAADTFRAAAIDQLEIWAQRADVDIIKNSEGTDPAAIVFDAISAAKARNTDLIIVDTAGRLHNKKNLMDELSKIKRIIDRELPDADKECLLVLDATTGQNAVNQASEFSKATGITGIILTKLDGTAKGGVVLNIRNTLGIPVKFVGVGEKLDDLQPFDPLGFSQALFSGEKHE